jgi:hypothetical protein
LGDRNQHGHHLCGGSGLRDTEQRIAGVVLTSSILACKVPGAVPTQKLSMIRVPTLVVDLIANWIIRPVE